MSEAFIREVILHAAVGEVDSLFNRILHRSTKMDMKNGKKSTTAATKGVF